MRALGEGKAEKQYLVRSRGGESSTTRGRGGELGGGAMSHEGTSGGESRAIRNWGGAMSHEGRE